MGGGAIARLRQDTALHKFAHIKGDPRHSVSVRGGYPGTVPLQLTRTVKKNWVNYAVHSVSLQPCMPHFHTLLFLKINMLK